MKINGSNWTGVNNKLPKRVNENSMACHFFLGGGFQDGHDQWRPIFDDQALLNSIFKKRWLKYFKIYISHSWENSHYTQLFSAIKILVWIKGLFLTQSYTICRIMREKLNIYKHEFWKIVLLIYPPNVRCNQRSSQVVAVLSVLLSSIILISHHFQLIHLNKGSNEKRIWSSIILMVAPQVASCYNPLSKQVADFTPLKVQSLAQPELRVKKKTQPWCSITNLFLNLIIKCFYIFFNVWNPEKK